MSHQSATFRGDAIPLDKKIYKAMQVLQLGELAKLTQTMNQGNYTDGGMVGQPNAMFGSFPE